MPQASEPYKFIRYEDATIPGIPREHSDPIYVGAFIGLNTSFHNLRPQPLIFGGAGVDSATYSSKDSLNTEYFDNVYMPQPKTREQRGGVGHSGPAAGFPTLNDEYRYWPAHRSTIGEPLTSSTANSRLTINGTIGCGRYESLNQKGSDEGAWSETVGANLGHTGSYLGSPNYKVIFSEGANDMLYDGTLIPTDWGVGTTSATSSSYIDAFLVAFAPGYFTDCCLRTVIDADHLEGPTEWGTFIQKGNIRYGINYYDDTNFFYGCWNFCCGPSDDISTTRTQVCGEVFVRESLATNFYDNKSLSFIPGGLLDGHETDAEAGCSWLSSTGTYNWRQSDIYETSEPTQYNNNDNYPGKFGIPDIERTSRHSGEVKCQSRNIGGKDDPQLPDGSSDLANEKCTVGCNGLGVWFANEGKTFPYTSI